jgi:hypothetical protein
VFVSEEDQKFRRNDILGGKTGQKKVGNENLRRSSQETHQKDQLPHELLKALEINPSCGKDEKRI